MIKEITVISADVDGKRLRQIRKDAKYYSRCGGKDDDREINEAIHSGKVVSPSLGDAWNRIFGRK